MRENVANNVAQGNSQDLTEQYQTGTLPCGFYYFDNGKEKYIVDYRSIAGVKKGIKGIEVLAPVPSYEEYLESESHCAVYSDINKWLKEENQQLKELLKECKPYIGYSINKKEYLEWTPPESNILTVIDNVIGEK